MTNWTSGVCEANGIEIHYSRTGGSKPPLVLLHGLTGSGVCWNPLERALEDEYDVVMPDARGHGKSSTPINGYRYKDHASDVVGLILGLRLAAPGDYIAGLIAQLEHDGPVVWWTGMQALGRMASWQMMMARFCHGHSGRRGNS